MKEQTAYKFDSKYLGEAFMKELQDLGYNIDSCYGEKVGNCKYLINDFGSKGLKNIGFNEDKSESNITFQLETHWNKALEHAKEQVQSKLKKGDWFYGRNAHSKFLARSTGKKETCGYQIDEYFWLYEHKLNEHCPYGGNTGHIEYFDRKATKEEVEQAFIDEARRRYEGVTKVYSLLETVTDKYNLLPIHRWYYTIENNSFHNGMTTYLYKDGKWAEPAKDELKFFNFDVKKSNGGNTIEIGCSSRTKNYLEQVKKDLYKFGDKSVVEIIAHLNKILD